MTPEHERTIHRLESRVDELTRRVQQLEAERNLRADAQRYRDERTARLGAAIGVKTFNEGYCTTPTTVEDIDSTEERGP